jgi:glycosyltransferase involved in cell wall biosynthesis
MKVNHRKKLISIIIPVYEEGENILLIYNEILKIWKNIDKKYEYEIIFVDDGSKDTTPEILEKLSNENKRVKYIQFSRNFGKEFALAAGFNNSSGDAVISMDADLEHPPNLILEFLDKWERGAEIIIGLKKNYSCYNFARRFLSLIFYKIQNFISETKISLQETDYRLLDKKVVNEFNKFRERARITRGLIDWLGFKKDYVYFYLQEKRCNKSKYNFLKLYKLAIETILSHSLFPLKLTGYLGIFITFLAIVLGLIVLVAKYILKTSWGLSITGTAILAIIILFSVGIILCSLGIIALYIANIQNEVINRPLYVIKKKKNF